MTYRFVILYFLLITSKIRLIDASYHERRLYEDLMRDYNTFERPVQNFSDPVIVYLKVSLQQVIDVDEKNQIVYLNAWLNYRWLDYKLKWDKNEYGGIDSIRFPSTKLWKPDILLYNSVDPTSFDSTFPTNMVVDSTSSVVWIPPGIFKISCKMEILYFPFNQHVCHMKFGSWTYSGLNLDLQPEEGGFDISEYLPNGEWTLPMTTVARSERFYECCPEPYPDVTFYLHLRRRTLYYGFNLIMPFVLTTAISLLSFALPPEAGEKITLQITVLLSICFFLSVLSEATPKQSECIPLIAKFFSCCMIIVTLSLCSSVYVLNIHYRTPETHVMGRSTKTILLYWLPYLLRMERPGVALTWECLPSIIPWTRPKKQSESLIRNIREAENSSRNSFDIEHRVHQYITGNGNGTIVKSSLSQNMETSLNFSNHPIDNTKTATLIILQRIFQELKIVTKRMIETDKETSQANDWKYCAQVVDKLCLYVFSFLICLTCCIIFTSAPYLIA
uniref:Neur_chan_LBD domain-containing protein n=1 Tax=Rhabditophanes sp. KR3021 TaxID=114890 RepID=A0AC35TKB6_9BILA